MMASTNTHLDGALRGVVAVGASAGGVEALTRLTAGLPDDLPYAILIALHVPPGAPSVLATILGRSGPLPAEAATDGVTVVQHPDEALYPAMPLNALQAGVVDHHVSATNVGALLACLADREIEERAMARDDEIENSLWVALRSLREKATLSRRLANHVGPGMLHNRYTDLLVEAERAVTVLGRRLSEATSGAGERGDG